MDCERILGMLDARAIEKVRWNPLAGSLLTTGSDHMVTTDGQEQHTAGMFKSYNVTFCGNFGFVRMFFLKTENKQTSEREMKLNYNS